MRILIVCSSGISTSIMVQSMLEHALDDEYIEAISIGKLPILIEKFDIVLVAPQISFMYDAIKEQCVNAKTECFLINNVVYGSMDGFSTMQSVREYMKNKAIKIEHNKKVIHMALFCMSGLSSYILKDLIVEEAKKQGYLLECDAFAVSKIYSDYNDYDIYVLGPQVFYMSENIRDLIHNKPIYIIDTKDYGCMNVEKILGCIITNLQEYRIIED